MARYHSLHLFREPATMDVTLPDWARRSNPVVRRHLGIYAKTIPPQVRPLVQLFLVQAGAILLTIPLPFIFNVTLPLITVSILILPIAVYFYGQVLASLGADAAMTMVSELSNNTFTLLQTTPIGLPQILLGKISASIWRRIDDLALLLLVVTIFSFPPVVLEYANLWPPDKFPVVSHLAMIIVIGASIARIALEPFMVAAIGVVVGTAVPVRSAAITTTLVIVGFYYLILNLLRLLHLPLVLRVLVEGVLPVALPLLITALALRLAMYLLSRD